MKSFLLIVMMFTSLTALAQNKEDTIICDGKDLSISLQDVRFYSENNYLPSLKINCNSEGKEIYVLASKMDMEDRYGTSDTTDGLLTKIANLLRSIMRVDYSEKHLNQKLALLLAAKTNGWKVRLNYKKEIDILIRGNGALSLVSMEII